MLSWKDYYTQEQVRQDRLREAQQQRLVLMLSRGIRDQRRKAWTQLLQGLGYRLISWGDALIRQVEERPVS